MLKTFFTLLLCAYGFCDQPKVYLQVKLNNNIDEHKENVYYDPGDIIDFSCIGKGMTNKIPLYQIVHEMGHGIQIPPHHVMEFTFRIRADNIDSKSIIYCTMKINDNVAIKSLPKKLIMNPGNGTNDLTSSYKEIQYSEDKPARHVCNQTGLVAACINYETGVIMDLILRSDNNYMQFNTSNISEDSKIVAIKPSDSGSKYYCLNINKNNNLQTYTREIYNKAKYLYVPNSGDYLSNGVKIGIGLGVAVCFIMVGYFYFRRAKKKKSSSVDRRLSNQDGHSTDPNRVIYADLELSDRATTASVLERYDSPYARIIGYVHRKK